ncbi:SDR family NAD(P)-dependent oxidoreductase [Pantoea sp. 9140]|uniref:SDR family NAD(P)-dependent oxidoreductase n=1 Tax=Pantoea sp. 9140 TaxID=1500896 RepID=UPI00068EBD62|nr:SDR family NAD(P)-dependent oxidoreductase [Pantoea sp. 9140]
MATSPAERNVRGNNFVFFGGSAGMGRAAALALARRGASVLIVGRGEKDGQAVVEAARAAGAVSADFLAGDLATVAGIQQVADGVRAWRSELHGVLHTAMAAFQGKQVTADGFEFAFALQYFARTALNRLLVERLAASGDGRVVHIAGDVPGFFKPDLDDLQFERRKWGFFKSVLGTHILGFLHIQEAAQRWRDLPVSLTATCVNSTKTKAMADPRMPLAMRLMGQFGTTPEVSATNAVRVLTQASAQGLNGAVLRRPKRFEPQALQFDSGDAARLWDITTELAAQRGLRLP